jgi:hypothetical protein
LKQFLVIQAMVTIVSSEINTFGWKIKLSSLFNSAENF